MICCYEMRKGRGSCVEPSSLKNFGSMFDAEAIHAQIPSNIEPNYQIGLNVRRNQPQGSNFGLKVRSRTGDRLPNELALWLTFPQEMEIRLVGLRAAEKGE